MLKLHLEKGDQLGRHLETAARRLQSVIQAASDTGYLRIYAYPRPAPILAATVVIGLAADAGARPIVSVSPRPPPVIDAPTVLLGYETLNYKGGDVDQPLYAVAPSIKTPPPPNAVYVDGDGSPAGLLGLTLLELGTAFARRSWIALLVAGVSLGEYSERSGTLIGLDKEFFDKARSADPSLGLELISTLRSFKPLTLPACDSLAATLDPYYPGLTGDPEYCRGLLESEGLGDLAGRPLGKLIDEEIEKLAVVVLRYLTEKVKVSRDVDYYVGYVPSSTRHSLVEDYRLAGLSLLGALESFDTLAVLYSSSSDLETVYPPLERWYMSLSSTMPRLVDDARPVRVKSVSWLRIYRVESLEGVPPSTLYRALVTVGKIPLESLLAFPRGGCLAVSPLQAEEAYGPGTAKKLLDTRVARQEGVLLCLEERSA